MDRKRFIEFTDADLDRLDPLAREGILRIWRAQEEDRLPPQPGLRVASQTTAEEHEAKAKRWHAARQPDRVDPLKRS